MGRRTRGTSGRTSRRVFKSWDRASSSWRTYRDISPRGSGKSSDRWPKWGMTRRGVAFEQQKPVLPTGANACSSLLPTPTAWLGGRPIRSTGDPKRWLNPDRSNELSDFVAWRLLPTPTARDWKDTGDLSKVPENSLLPRVVFNKLLPTPRAQNGESRNMNIWERPADQPQNLENALAHVKLLPSVDWGEYEPAIRHWEALTRPAPEPSVDSRLNSRFVEWMMGLRDGHVTSPHHDLSTAQQLKILGNGVVPQQAALALSVLFERANVHAVLDPP